METDGPLSLWMYLENVFLPAVQQSVQPGTSNAYRKAVRRFVAWCGTDVAPDDVTEFLVERWLRSMLIDGVGWKTARGYSVCVRRVVRSASPARCQKKAGRRPHEAAATVLPGLTESELRSPSRSLLKFFQDVYVPRRMIGCRPGSIDQIRWSIGRFAKFLGRPPLIDDLSNETVSRYMSWCLNVRGLSLATVNSSRQQLVSLWNYAAKRQLIRERPNDVDKLKERRSLPKAWSLDEFARLLAAAHAYRSEMRNMIYQPARFFVALFLCGYDSGLRLGSLLGIRRQDWNSSRREITVDAAHQKHRVAQSFVVSKETADAIHAMLADCQATAEELPEFLFHWPARRDQLFYHVRRILKNAGLYCAGEDTFHRIRKTSATHLAAAIGLEAACRQLGHSDVSMTKRYVDPRHTSQFNAAEHLPRPSIRNFLPSPNPDSGATAE